MSTFRLHIEAARFRWERHEALSGSDRHSGDTVTASGIQGIEVESDSGKIR